MHVLGCELTVVLADEGFVEEFAEIIVWPAETAVEDAGKGSLRVAARALDRPIASSSNAAISFLPIGRSFPVRIMICIYFIMAAKKRSMP